MLPSAFLQSSQNEQVEVVMKNGDVYSGMLKKSDLISNLVLSPALLTKADGTDEELYCALIPGDAIKYMLLPKKAVEDARNLRRNKRM